MAIIQVAINESGRRIGHDHHRAKLTNGEVDLVLTLRAEGWTYAGLAAKFEVCKSTIRSICTGRCRSQYPVAFRVVHIID